MSSSVIKAGFIAAAVANISGVLLFSKGLTNTVLMETDPVVMSSFGLIMIMVWGLAYLAAAFTQANLKWFAAAFAVEKLVYVICWLTWISWMCRIWHILNSMILLEKRFFKKNFIPRKLKSIYPLKVLKRGFISIG